MRRKMIGIKCVIDFETIEGELITNDAFHHLDAVSQLDVLSDWLSTLKQLHNVAYERQYRGVLKFKEAHEGNVIKAIENLEQFHNKNPDDLAGLAAQAIALIQARNKS